MAPGFTGDMTFLKAVIPTRPDGTDLYKHIKSNPWDYLKSMVLITRKIEADFPTSRRSSPFMLRESEIPKHILIDTPTLKDLLLGMRNDEAEEQLRSRKKMEDIARLGLEKFGSMPAYTGKGAYKNSGNLNRLQDHECIIFISTLMNNLQMDKIWIPPKPPLTPNP
jgi:hypothetical protein